MGRMWDVFYEYWMSKGQHITPTPIKVAKRFPGYKVGSAAWGTGDQGCCLTCEGEDTQKLVDIVSRGTFSPSFHATRIDIQVTAKTASDFVPISVIKNGVWSTWKARGKIIEDEVDMGTFYLNRRTSPKFWRIYHKEVREGETWMRVEIEIKKHVAASLWTLGLSDDNIRAYMCTEFFKLNMTERVRIELKAHTDIMRGASFLKLERVPKGKSGTLEWLDSTVTPAIVRLLNDPDESDYMIGILQGWVAIARESGRHELSIPML